jgi:Helicase conserved C-terminal domain
VVEPRRGDFFLISLKAGGFGLNLTVVDYVIIADPWWNPAAEDQASGRAHRIGQLRPVTVYRLVTQGSIEDRIVRRTLLRDIDGSTHRFGILLKIQIVQPGEAAMAWDKETHWLVSATRLRLSPPEAVYAALEERSVSMRLQHLAS